MLVEAIAVTLTILFLCGLIAGKVNKDVDREVREDTKHHYSQPH